MRRIILSLIALCAIVTSASAQTAPAPLKSFAYVSNGCSGGLFTFGSSFQINGSTPPGSFIWPTGDFYIRKVSLTITNPSPNPTAWAIVGHSGPNGDWITSPVFENETRVMPFSADAAPLFTAGEYFDVHGDCDGSTAILAVWWEPAP